MKKAILLFMCFMLIFFVFSSTAFADQPGYGSGDWSNGWGWWSQGQSAYWGVRGYGCLVVAQAKMLVAAGIASSDTSAFNPDRFFEWEAANDYIQGDETEDYYMVTRNYAGPEAYAGAVGKTMYFEGVTYGNNHDKVWENINSGKYTILRIHCPDSHYILVNNGASIETGKIRIFQSWDSATIPGTRDLENSISEILTYSVPSTPSTFELDVNGMLDGAESGWVKDYATFDLYVNGSRVANDINDYCAQVNAGSSYEIKDIKVADGKAFDGYSGYTRSGYASGSRTGTVNSYTDVRLQLHTVTAAGLTSTYSPTKVVAYNGHSYYFYGNLPVTWYDAKIICEYLGGHLVTITSSGENSFVNELAGKKSVWIGATDKDSEGSFKWVTGESFSYKNWASGEPNNDASIGEGSENFVHLLSDLTWNDSAGCAAYPFVCEIDRAYTITYNPNGGTGSISSQVKAVGQAIKLSTVRPIRDGYTFLGWATSSSATTARFQPGDTYSTDANLTLYAVWKRDGNTIHYIANGGENPPADQFKASGETVTLSTDIPTRRGYTFLGWGMSANATAPSYQPGDSYSANANLTLYALWRITNPPTLRGKDASMLVGDTRDLADFVELSHDGVLSYTLTATAAGVVSLDGQRVTATAVGSGALTVSVAEYPAASCAVNIRVVDLSQMLRLPAALTEIGSGAFENSGIAAVTLPEGCASIGNRAFAENAGLVYIYIPASVSQIAQNAFVNSPNTVIYCYAGSMAAIFAENNNIRCVLLDSGWVAADQLPPGARVTDEKWTYQRTSTETTTSTASSMPGWTQSGYEWQPAGSGTHTYANYPGGFDTGHSLYGKYNKAALSSSTSGNTKREVGASAVNSYIFWHWTFVDYVEEDNRNVVISDVMEYGAPAGSVSRDFIYFDAFETGDSLNGNPGMTKNGLQCFNDEGIYSTYNTSYDIADYASWWWYRTTVYKQSYTDYQKLFTYTRTVTSEESSAVAVTEGGEISNVQHWVKYVL